MVTLELPQARRLAGSVVLGQVVVTLVAAAICFAVWGRVAGLSALAGGGISAAASAVLAFFAFGSPAGADAERVARGFYVGEGLKLAVTVALFVVGVSDDEGLVRRAVRHLHRNLVRVLDRPGECVAALSGRPGRQRERGQALGIEKRWQQNIASGAESGRTSTSFIT